MRAIKHLNPDVGADAMVDVYLAADVAALNPDDPVYSVALRELLNTEVLRRSPKFDYLTATIDAHQHYEVTPEGARQVGSA
jgi:hypothetical protein